MKIFKVASERQHGYEPLAHGALKPRTFVRLKDGGVAFSVRGPRRRGTTHTYCIEASAEELAELVRFVASPVDDSPPRTPHRPSHALAKLMR